MAVIDEARGFRPLDESSLVAYSRTTLALGTSLHRRIDTVKEVVDCNLNFIYIVTCDAGFVIVKQVLP
ncbi:methylthioribose kinase 2 [Hordeum vulgare]|nr:methylthioribose kinase 2 [Hordeum vulgare]